MGKTIEAKVEETYNEVLEIRKVNQEKKEAQEQSIDWEKLQDLIPKIILIFQEEISRRFVEGIYLNVETFQILSVVNSSDVITCEHKGKLARKIRRINKVKTNESERNWIMHEIKKYFEIISVSKEVLYLKLKIE